MVVAQLIAIASSLNVQYVVPFVIVFLLTIAWVRGRGPPNLPPGPLALPVIGNALGLQKDQLHYVLADWAKEYGSIMRIWLGPHLAIVLNDINAAKEALVKQADCFSDRITDANGRPRWGKGSIAMSNGDVLKERRRFMLSAMRHLGMGKKSVEHMINEEARHLTDSLDRKGEKPFDPEHIINNAVSNIICTISLGKRFEYSDPKFACIIHCLKKTLQFVSFAGYYFFRKPAKGTPEWIEKVVTFIKDVVKEHQKSFDPNDIRDIIDVYLVEIEQHEKSEKVIDEDSALCRTTLWRGIYELFVTGTDTTSKTVLWMLLFMTIYQDVQEKVQKEIDDVIGRDRQPTSEDRNNMPYTNAVLMEVQRVRPAAPYGVPYQTHYETELLGYTIPANTNVIVNTWTIQRDLKYWKDPEKFNPTRFMSKDGKTVENYEAFIPFSLGRRACLGEILAKMEFFLFFVNLLQRFTLSLPADKPRPSLDGIIGITFGPNPYEIVAKRR